MISFHKAIFSVIALGLTGTAAADDAFDKDAYDACVMYMSHNIFAPSGDKIEFAPIEKVITSDEYEVMISFSAGSITGAEMAEPHPLTLMTQPAGSCIAEPGVRKFHRVVVNGEIFSDDAVFDMDHNSMSNDTMDHETTDHSEHH
jgi:hypothetical protein